MMQHVCNLKLFSSHIRKGKKKQVKKIELLGVLSPQNLTTQLNNHVTNSSCKTVYVCCLILFIPSDLLLKNDSKY